MLNHNLINKVTIKDTIILVRDPITKEQNRHKLIKEYKVNMDRRERKLIQRNNKFDLDLEVEIVVFNTKELQMVHQFMLLKLL